MSPQQRAHQTLHDTAEAAGATVPSSRRMVPLCPVLTKPRFMLGMPRIVTSLRVACFARGCAERSSGPPRLPVMTIHLVACRSVWCTCLQCTTLSVSHVSGDTRHPPLASPTVRLGGRTPGGGGGMDGWHAALS